MDRVIVFMDYQNVHGWARRQFRPIGSDPALGHVNPMSLAELIVSRRRRPSKLEAVRVYRGRPNPERQPGAARANDRQASDWTRAGAEVIRRNLSYPAAYPQQPAAEKGIDVALAVDLVRLAMQREMECAVVFSGDKDLLPALETCRDLRLCHIEVASWAGAHRLRFANPNSLGATTSTLPTTSPSRTPSTTPFPDDRGDRRSAAARKP